MRKRSILSAVRFYGKLWDDNNCGYCNWEELEDKLTGKKIENKSEKDVEAPDGFVGETRENLIERVEKLKTLEGVLYLNWLHCRTGPRERQLYNQYLNLQILLNRAKTKLLKMSKITEDSQEYYAG